MKRLLAPLLFFAFNTAHADDFAAKIIWVIDGDTVVAIMNRHKTHIRLTNIDAPEKDQPYGDESRRALMDKVLKQEVRVTTRGTDKYGRTLGELSVNGESINEAMVREGYAWEYSWRHSNKSYVELQREAESARRGLWTDNSPMPPWQWRKLHPH
jgi:micrococcal nuclease